MRHSLQGAQRLRPVAAGVAEDDLVPSAAKLALDGVGCAGIMGIPDVHCEHSHRVQALADHALRNGTGSVVAAFEHLFHLGAGVCTDGIFVVEHAGDGGDRDSGFPCNIVNIHRPSCKIRCGWMVKAYPAAVWTVSSHFIFLSERTLFGRIAAAERSGMIEQEMIVCNLFIDFHSFGLCGSCE